MSKPKQTAFPSAALPQSSPSDAEQAAIRDARARVAARRPRLTTTLKGNKDGSIAEIGPEHTDYAGWMARLEDLFGTRGNSFAASQLNHVLMSVRDANGQYDRVKANAMLAVVEGARPADELQAMLALQLAVTHDLTMQALRRASRADQIPQYESAGAMAVKLMRAFGSHIELLAKLQRGGEQTVRVEHVHVHAGGQAVVGNVTTGGGAKNEIGNQPQAPVALPPGTVGHLTAERGAALLGQDAEREPVPISSGQR